MIQGAKDIRELEQQKVPNAAPGNKRDTQLAKFRAKALAAWASEGRDLVEEARRKDQRSMSLAPVRNKMGKGDARLPVVQA